MIQNEECKKRALFSIEGVMHDFEEL